MQQAVQRGPRVPAAGYAHHRCHQVQRYGQRQHGDDVLEGAVVVEEGLVAVAAAGGGVPMQLTSTAQQSHLAAVPYHARVDEETGRGQRERHQLHLGDDGVDVSQSRLPATAGHRDVGGVVTLHTDMVRERLHVRHVRSESEDQLCRPGEPSGGEQPAPGAYHDSVVLQRVNDRHKLVNGVAHLRHLEGNADSESVVLQEPTQDDALGVRHVVDAYEGDKDAKQGAGEGHVSGQHGHRLLPEVAVTHHGEERQTEVGRQQRPHHCLHPGVQHGLQTIRPSYSMNKTLCT